ncbi:MAG: WYL domain-containing protein, partial [Clostridia bacterium]|nr:WYL domain-containing protein [Clostridia bacterium]
DVLHRAIAAKRKITFSYGRRVLDEAGKIVLSTKDFRVSPYGLLWYDDRYYLIGNNEKYDNLMHLRVDRMHKVEMTNEPYRSFEEVSHYRNFFDIADYAGKLSNAFSGEPVTMELCCKEELLESVLDRFGKDVPVRKGTKEGRFLVRVKAAMSDGLVHDILNYGDGVEVVSPGVLRQKVAGTVDKLYSIYAQSRENGKN